MYNKIIKIISCFICAVILFSSVCAISCMCSSPCSIVCENSSAKSGGIAILKVSIQNNPGIALLRLTVSFDKRITLSRADNGDVFDDFDTGLNLLWSADADVCKNGTLALLTFDLPKNIPAGDYNVTVTCKECYNSNFQNIDISTAQGKITVRNDMENCTPIDEFNYTLSQDEICITGHTGASDNLIIGAHYTVSGKQYAVTKISESAFEGNKNITNVVLPETVKQIDDCAFYDCTALKSVTVYGKNSIIGELSFGYYYISRKQDGKVDGFKLICYEKSLALLYAEENGFNCEQMLFYGEVNGDGTLDVQDLIIMCRSLLNNSVSFQPQLDMNDDAKFNLRDLLILKKRLAKQ